MSILATSLPMLPVFYWPWRRALPASALLPRGAAVHLSCEQPHAEIDDAQLLACGLPLPAVGVTEIEVDSAAFSLATLDAAARRIGLASSDICWIAPSGDTAPANELACGWNIYCPRSAREATWATERALVSSGVSAVAAWFACCPADRRASEGRLLRRLRALARRHGKSLLILRYGATPG